MQFFSQCLIAFCGRNHLFFNHIVENVTLAQTGTLGIHDRIKRGGRFRQAGQDGGLSQSQLFYRFVEVNLRSGSKAVGALTQVDLVEIQLQNLLFT